MEQLNSWPHSTQLAELEKDKKSAARANFRMKVERITQNIESYAAEKTKFVEKCQDAESRLTGITADLNAMDTRLRSLGPHLKLDKLDQRCKSVEPPIVDALNKRTTSEQRTSCS